MQTYPECSAQITDSQILYDYMHGGQGVIKLEAPSGKSHLYAIIKPINSSDFPNDTYFIYAIHETKKFYLGVLEDDSFRLTKNSRFLSNTEIVKGANYLVSMMNNPLLLSASPMKIYHMGMCARCGRKLTSSKTLKIGFGKKCLRIYNISAMNNDSEESFLAGLPDYV